jgi:hypothetical protein
MVKRLFEDLRPGFSDHCAVRRRRPGEFGGAQPGVGQAFPDVEEMAPLGLAVTVSAEGGVPVCDGGVQRSPVPTAIDYAGDAEP